MPITAFTFVELFRKQIAVTAHLLGKAEAHVATSGAGAEAFLDWRLTDDMHPLRFQITVVCNFGTAWPARVADVPEPAAITSDLDLQGFRDALARADAFLATLTPEQFAGRDDLPYTRELMPGMAPTMSFGQWLTSFAATNVYFHVSMIYAILRARGVPLGKIDAFGGSL